MDTYQGAVLSKTIFGKPILIPADAVVIPHGYVMESCSYTPDGVRWGSLYFGLVLSHVNLKRAVKCGEEVEVMLGRNEGWECLTWEKAIELPDVRRQVVAIQQALAELNTRMLELYLVGRVDKEECLTFLSEKNARLT